MDNPLAGADEPRPTAICASACATFEPRIEPSANHSARVVEGRVDLPFNEKSWAPFCATVTGGCQGRMIDVRTSSVARSPARIQTDQKA